MCDCLQHHFGVAGGAKYPSSGFHFKAKFFEVIDLAVKYQCVTFIRSRHRLDAGGNIDNRQTAMA